MKAQVRFWAVHPLAGNTAALWGMAGTNPIWNWSKLLHDSNKPGTSCLYQLFMHRCKNWSLFFLQVNISLRNKRAEPQPGSRLTLEHLPMTPLCLLIPSGYQHRNPKSQRSWQILFFFPRIISSGLLALHFHQSPKELCPDSLTFCWKRPP